ncbi:hypothetical protein RFI_13048 [Reticulomyxa filosa]|uniref:Uncharacterized protein n=1 Tax=Reticulomyxa filosa TaxID=46433 RepID=X6NFJ2_RETFI|nr:hypothetical protein RFI_13048 [Reticulomyxa filosa]|eukprot:ETO24112.1 hypothetical protein RFI_13048 [Reticulomyxa filosa]
MRVTSFANVLTKYRTSLDMVRLSGLKQADRFALNYLKQHSNSHATEHQNANVPPPAKAIGQDEITQTEPRLESVDKSQHSEDGVDKKKMEPSSDEIQANVETNLLVKDSGTTSEKQNVEKNDNEWHSISETSLEKRARFEKMMQEYKAQMEALHGMMNEDWREGANDDIKKGLENLQVPESERQDVIPKTGRRSGREGVNQFAERQKIREVMDQIRQIEETRLLLSKVI